MKQPCSRISRRVANIAAPTSRAFASWSEPAAARRLRRLYWPENVHTAPSATTPPIAVPQATSEVSKRFLKRSPSIYPSRLGQTSSWHGQTLASSNPLNTSSDDLLAHVEPLPPSHDTPTSASAVVLVTKQFATLLVRNDEFLRNVLSKLWSKNEGLLQADAPGTKAFVLAAVVDRIPLDQEQLEGKASVGLGSEGIAICASNNVQLVDPEFDSIDSTPELHTRALKLDEQPPTISFQLQFSNTAEDGNLEIMLPIAQTLFHANEPSVVALSRWKLSKSRPTKLAQGFKKNSNYGVTLPVASPISAARTMLPLAQLTGPRKIKSVMGNVIRELEETSQTVDPDKFGEIIGQEGGGSTSASSELEEAVAALITMPGAFTTPVGVWALVIPEEVTTSDAYAALTHSTDMALDNISTGRGASSNTALQDLIFSGATLRHVLGGGGGWGNKAGLLSLDPYSDYVQRSSEDHFDLDGSDPMSFLRGTASPGDRIVFYAVVDTVGEVYSTTPAGLEFGVIPSTVDDMPSAPDASGSDRKIPVRRFSGRFGFLSEIGLSITKRGRSPTLPVRSRLDVPFSRISLKTGSGDN